LSPKIPEGFDAFWSETSEEALSEPLDFEREPGNAFELPGFRIDTFTFRNIKREPRHGWIAEPENGQSFPAFLWVPPYGRESLLPNAYGTRSGFVSASLNFFGHGAFHQEKYNPSRGYFTEGVLDPHTFILKSLFQDAVLAARVLKAQPRVHSNTIGAMGMSQGGGISIWLGAFVPWIARVCADMPFFGGVSQTLGNHVYRYPLKELIDYSQALPGRMESIRSTLTYFDTLNVATRCKKPTQVSLGEKDPAAKPASVEAVFAALPCPKILRRYRIGHDWYPEMIPNNIEWLKNDGD
jgi:cephalosporin-C deacetylase